MDIRPPPKVMAWLGPLILINVFVWIVFTVPEVNTVFCEHTQNCFATWTGALSGWVAAGAAAITIGILIRQVDSQNKQTDFLLGDAHPTVDAVQHTERTAAVVVQLVNWNRRAVSLSAIAVRHPKKRTVGLNVWRGGTTITELTDRFEFYPRILVRGWVDRTKAPTVEEIRLNAGFGSQDGITDGLAIADWADAEVTLEYEIVGLAGVVSHKVRVHMTNHDVYE